MEIGQIRWLRVEDCDPPHGVTHQEHASKLIASIINFGWNDRPLQGYKLHDRIQLLSGSHRYAAAKWLDIYIPVVLYEYDYLCSIWGTDEWGKILTGDH